MTPPRFNFGAAPTTNMTSAPTWSFGSSQQANKSSPTTSPTSSQFDSPWSTSLDPTPSKPPAASLMQEQPTVSPPTGLVFAAVSTDSTGTHTTKKIQDPATILDGDIYILRVYLSLEDLPPKSLDGMFLHFQNQGANPLHEIHLCIRSLLRPCLQGMEEDYTLQEKMLFMVDQWFTFGTAVKFFFHRPGVEVDRDRFQNFVEKDFKRAVEGLREHDVELSEILGEESWVLGRDAAYGDTVGAPEAAEQSLHDEMI